MHSALIFMSCGADAWAQLQSASICHDSEDSMNGTVGERATCMSGGSESWLHADSTCEWDFLMNGTVAMNENTSHYESISCYIGNLGVWSRLVPGGQMEKVDRKRCMLCLCLQLCPPKLLQNISHRSRLEARGEDKSLPFWLKSIVLMSKCIALWRVWGLGIARLSSHCLGLCCIFSQLERCFFCWVHTLWLGC